MLIISGNDISLSRGNTAVIDVNIFKDDEPYILREGESIVFNLKRSCDFNSVVLSKESETNSFVFNPIDTAPLGLGAYDYSITYLGDGGEIDTFITGKFTIMCEVSEND